MVQNNTNTVHNPSPTYTVTFFNSRSGQVTFLHTQASFEVARRELDEYQKSWKGLASPSEQISRTSTSVKFHREGYYLRVWFIRNDE